MTIRPEPLRARVDQDLAGRAALRERAQAFLDERVERNSWPCCDDRDIASRQQVERRGRRLLCSACLDDNVEPDAAAELEQQAGEIEAGRIRSLRRAESRCRCE